MKGSTFFGNTGGKVCNPGTAVKQPQCFQHLGANLGRRPEAMGRPAHREGAVCRVFGRGLAIPNSHYALLLYRNRNRSGEHVLLPPSCFRESQKRRSKVLLSAFTVLTRVLVPSGTPNHDNSLVEQTLILAVANCNSSRHRRGSVAPPPSARSTSLLVTSWEGRSWVSAYRSKRRNISISNSWPQQPLPWTRAE